MLKTSFNIYGLANRFKHNKVRELIISKFLKFLATLETKAGDFSNSFVYVLWGNYFHDWSFSPSSSNGDLLSIWCSSKGSSIFSFAGTTNIGVSIKWGMSKMLYFVVFILSVA